MNCYYRSIDSEEMSDFEHFYSFMATNLPPDAYIAECGVAHGRSVILLASLMNVLEKPCTIWAVDNFSYGLDAQREIFERNVKNSGETTIVTMDMDSLTASCRCQDGQFDFVFIDSSHLYEQTKAEIRLWLHKVKAGGILAGHDYEDNQEVKRAVDELIPPEDLVSYPTTAGHGVWYLVKKEGQKLLK